MAKTRQAVYRPGESCLIRRKESEITCRNNASTVRVWPLGRQVTVMKANDKVTGHLYPENIER